jgi:hypothetical protein
VSRKNQPWKAGDIFCVEQSDGKSCVGQIVGLMMPNVPSCAFYDLRFSGKEVPTQIDELSFEKLIASLSTTRELLDRRIWRIIAHISPCLPQQFWPNEPCRDVGWVGARTYGAGIVEDFLNAFYGLAPWNCYADPRYFDRMLFSPERKPEKIIMK